MNIDIQANRRRMIQDVLTEQLNKAGLNMTTQKRFSLINSVFVTFYHRFHDLFGIMGVMFSYINIKCKFSFQENINSESFFSRSRLQTRPSVSFDFAPFRAGFSSNIFVAFFLYAFFFLLSLFTCLTNDLSTCLYLFPDLNFYLFFVSMILSICLYRRLFCVFVCLIHFILLQHLLT